MSPKILFKVVMVHLELRARGLSGMTKFRYRTYLTGFDVSRLIQRKDMFVTFVSNVGSVSRNGIMDNVTNVTDDTDAVVID